jgi:lipopolysaccharide export system permease protein
VSTAFLIVVRIGLVIITRYLTREIMLTTTMVAMVVLFIFISNQFVRYLGASATGHLFGTVVGQLLLIQVPYLLSLLLPLSLYIGLILTLSRMYTDNEITVCFASGMSYGFLTTRCLGIGCVIAILVTALNIWINPLLAEKQQVILQKAKTATLLQAIAPGRFISFADGRNIAYVADVSSDGKHFDNVFLALQAATPASPDQWDIMVARKGYTLRDHQTKDHYLVTTDGYRYVGEPGQGDYRIAHYGKYGVLSDGSDAAIVLKQNEKMIPLSDLWQGAFHSNKLAAELQWRLALPISVFVLVLLALPLSHVAPRQGRFAKLLPAILLYVIYANLILMMRDSISRSLISPWLGLWWVHGLFLLTAFILIARQRQWLYRWQEKRVWLKENYATH